MEVIFFLIAMYLACLLGLNLTYPFTDFIKPQGLWNLVPFRVSGWRSHYDPRKIYNLKWAWEKLDFNNWRKG